MNREDKRKVWSLITDPRVQSSVRELKELTLHSDPRVNNHLFHSIVCEYIDEEYYTLDDILPGEAFYWLREHGMYIRRAFVGAFINEMNSYYFRQWCDYNKIKKKRFKEAIELWQQLALENV